MHLPRPDTLHALLILAAARELLVVGQPRWLPDPLPWGRGLASALPASGQLRWMDGPEQPPAPAPRCRWRVLRQAPAPSGKPSASDPLDRFPDNSLDALVVADPLYGDSLVMAAARVLRPRGLLAAAEGIPGVGAPGDQRWSWAGSPADGFRFAVLIPDT